jgi:hypothetical protein
MRGFVDGRPGGRRRFFTSLHIGELVVGLLEGRRAREIRPASCQAVHLKLQELSWL